MPLPEDVTAGVTLGHLSHHEVLRVRHNADGATPALTSDIVEDNDQHDNHHDAFKLWYDAAHPGTPLLAFTTWASHELIHEALAIWDNARAADTTPPATPTGLAATPASSTTINLTWDVTTDTTHYLLYRNAVLLFIQPASDPRTFADVGLVASTQYSYTIAARDGVGNTSALSAAVLATTNPVPDVTPPATPTGFTVTATAPTVIDVSWNASATATSYVLRRSAVVIATQAGLTFSDTGRTPETEYSYTVSALDASANASPQTTATNATTPAVPPDLTPPSVPTGLVATPASSSSVNLSWDASTGSPVSYTVRRGGLIVFTQAGLTATDIGLNPATLYSYTVTATDAADNESVQSGAAAATTTDSADITPPPIPTGLTATPADSTIINVSWLAAGDATSYTLRRDGVSIAVQAGLTFSDTGRTAATLYSYTVAASDAAGNFSAQSAAATATTLATPDTTAPTIPGGVAAVATSPTSIMVTWDASTDAVGIANYTIRRGGIAIATQAADLPLTYTDTGLIGSTLYSYTVAATDQVGNTSAQSGAATATTPVGIDATAPSVPTLLRTTVIDSTSATLAWNASTDDTSVATYTLLRDDVVVVATVTGLTAISAGLLSSTTYSFTVLATDAAGNSSAQSPPLIVVTSAPLDVTPPPTPTGLRSTAISAEQVNLAWDASEEVVTYPLQRSGIVIATTEEPSHSDNTVFAATIYTYAIAAMDSAGNVSPFSAAITVSVPAFVDTIPPTVPTGLTATTTSTTSITLSWNASGGAGVYDRARYDIDIYDDGDVANYILRRNGTIIATQPGLTFVDTGLTPATNYTYTIASIDAVGNESAQSTVVGATTAAISAISFSEPFTSTLALTWTNYLENIFVSGGTKGSALGDESHHRAEHTVGSTDMYSEVTWEDTATDTNRSVGVATRYSSSSDTCYFMRLSDVDDNFSLWKIVNGTRTRLFGPTVIAGGTAFPGTIRLESQGSSHRCYFKGNLLTTVTDASIPTGTRGGLVFLNSLGGILVDNFKTGSLAGSSGDVTAPTVPGSVSATATSFSTITLTWAPSTDAVGVTNYTVRRDGVAIVSPTASPFFDTGLTASTLYSYTVTASDASGNTSAQSSAATATTSAGAALRTALNRFELELPTGVANNVDIISRDALVAGYSDVNLFNNTADGLGFHVRCRADGVRAFAASTGAATQLRQVKADGSNDAWSSSTATTRTWEATYRVNHLPSSDPEVTLWQMNNGTTEALALRLTNEAGGPRLALHSGTGDSLGTGDPRGWLIPWKLQIPVDADGSGASDDIKQPALATYTSTWFQLTADSLGFRMRARMDGARTSTSTNYPRCELREMVANGSTEAAWSTSGYHKLSVIERITNLPPNKPEIVVMQVHDGSDDLFTLRLEGSDLGWYNGSPKVATVTTNYILGTQFTADIVVTAGRAYGYFNGVLTSPSGGVTIGSASTNYFKAGAYPQSNTSYDSASAYGEMELRGISVFHGTVAPPATVSAITPYFDTSYTYGEDFIFKVSVGNDLVSTWYNGAAQHVAIAAPNDTGINFFKAGLYNQFGTASAGATEYSDADMRAVSYTEIGAGSLPDLVVTDITWSPASPSAGQPVTFTAAVTNSGATATPDGIVIGVAFTVNGGQVSFAGGDTNSLGAGASRSFVANSVPATWFATPGTHTVMAYVDDADRIVETNEGNNTRSEATLVVTGAGVTPGPVGTPTLIEQATGTSLAVPVPTGSAVGEVLVLQLSQSQTSPGGGAPIYRSITSTYHEAGAGTPTACTKPSGLATGDVLLAFLSSANSASNQNGEASTIPSGFTAIAPYRESTGGSAFWYYKPITNGGGEPATYSFAVTPDNGLAIYLIAYSGVDTSAPIHVAATATASSSTSGLPLSVTTSISNTTLVAFGAADDSVDHTFGTGGMTSTRLADQNVTGDNFNNYIHEETAASTGIKTRNLSYTGEVSTAVPNGILLALKGASAASAPGGWIEFASSMSTVKAQAYYRVVTGTETATYTWSNLFNGPATAMAQRFQGIDTGTPMDVTAVTANSASIVDLVVPSITTVTNGAVLLSGAVLNALTTTNATTPAGMTLLNSATGTGQESSWAYETRATAGATGTRTWGQNPTGTARAYAGWSGALRPAGGGPPPDPDPDPTPTVPVLTGPSGTLVHAVVGGVTSTQAVVVAKTSTSTQTRLKVSTAADLLTTPLYSSIITPDANGMSRLTVTGLNPFTAYSFGVECGPALDSAKRGKFKTTAITAASVSVAFGSCLNASDSVSFGRMQARNPNLFIHLGDFFYDDGASQTASSFRSHYDAKIGASGQGALMRNVASAYTWSDHDFALSNNGVGTANATVTATSQAVWRQYMPYWGPLPHAAAIYQTFALTSRVRVIITDNRSFKSSNSATDNSSKTVLGSTQKAWFKALITNSTEPIILWANEQPWIGSTNSPDDEWHAYNTERQELGTYIDASNKHVIILAGDMHACAFDSGTNSAGNIPVFHAAPFGNSASIKGGPYSGGISPSSGTSTVQQYGMVTITDTGTTTITVKYDGYGSSNTVIKTTTLSLSVSAETTPPPTSGGFNGWTPGTSTLPPLLPNFPAAATTGVFNDNTRTTLTVVNGDYAANTANALITGLRITGDVTVNASGVRFELCWIEGRISGHSSRPIFIHCDIGHTSVQTDTNDNFRYAVSVYRCNIFAGQDGIKPTGSDCVFQDNFVHDMGIQVDTGQSSGISHNDCIQMNDDTTNCRIIHNTFMNWGLNFFASPPQVCTRNSGPNWGEHVNSIDSGNVSSTIQINGTSGGSGLLIQDNYFDGNPDWVINMGDPGPSTTLRGNRFVRTGQNSSNQSTGPISGESRIDTSIDNRFTDNNGLIPGSSA